MLCAGIKISALEQAYIKAWNHLADVKERYLPECQQAIIGNGAQKAYRAKELISLVEGKLIEGLPMKSIILMHAFHFLKL